MFKAAALLVAAALTACDAGNSGSRGPAVATTPQAAAIGFHRSLTAHQSLRFECLRGPRGQLSTPMGMTGRLVAHARKRGSTWTVTVTTVGDRSRGVRYRVRHHANGFCVYDELEAFG